MAELYKGGMTLQRTGDQYGLTRERVRQIIKELGLCRNDVKPRSVWDEMRHVRDEKNDFEGQ